MVLFVVIEEGIEAINAPEIAEPGDVWFFGVKLTSFTHNKPVAMRQLGTLGGSVRGGYMMCETSRYDHNGDNF